MQLPRKPRPEEEETGEVFEEANGGQCGKKMKTVPQRECASLAGSPRKPKGSVALLNTLRLTTVSIRQ